MRMLFLALLLLPVLLKAQLPRDTALLKNAFELVEATGTLEILNESEARYTEKRRIIILGAKSRANLFFVRYDSENKIEAMDADLLDIRGNPIRKVFKNEIRDVAAVDGFSIYTDDRIRYLELEHNQYPYIVEYTYTQKLKGISRAALPSWYFQEAYTSGVIRSSFTLIVPAGMQDINYRVQNIELSPDIQKNNDGATSYTWTATSLPPIKEEELAPPAHAILPVLHLSSGDFRVKDYKGSMKDWQRFGAFLHTLWSQRDEVPADLRQKLNTLVASSTSNRERIGILYKYLQDNKRYVSVQLGVGGWQPFDAAYVEEHGYGDCKALSNYMRAMLKAVGMESYPVVIQAGDERPYPIEDDFVLSRFNHAILYIPEEDMWLECTSSMNPPGYLGQWANNRKVLLVTPQGGELKQTPHLDAASNTSVENAEFVLSADGAAQIAYTATTRGILHEDWRGVAYYGSEEDKQAKIRSMGRLPTLSIAAVDIQCHEMEPEAVVKFEAQSERYASKSGKRMFVPLNPVALFGLVPAEAPNRRFDAVLPFGYTQNTTITISLPEGYTVESMPKDLTLETAYGTYTWRMEAVADKVTVYRSFLLNDEDIPAGEYEIFRQFLIQISKQDSAKMVLISG